jgi:hypothetical protein
MMGRTCIAKRHDSARDATDVERLRELVRIEDVLTARGIEPGGRGRTNCPLCTGTSRNAFSFSAEKWHCFRCQEGGDVFRLIERLDGVDFPEAIARVAAIAGVDRGGLPRLNDAELTRRRRRLRRIAALRDWRNRLALELADRGRELDGTNAWAQERLGAYVRDANEWGADRMREIIDETALAVALADRLREQLETADDHTLAALWLARHRRGEATS